MGNTDHTLVRQRLRPAAFFSTVVRLAGNFAYTLRTTMYDENSMQGGDGLQTPHLSA